MKSKVFFCDNSGLDNYLKLWVTGTFPMGLKTNMETLDEHFRFKPAQLNIYGGIDNVGKSTVIWYLMLISSLLHRWKWLIYTAENNHEAVIKKMIEFYWCKPVTKMNETQIKIAKDFILEHFKFIDTSGLANYKDIISFIEQYSEHDGVLIDPWNALTESGAGNKHDQDYEAIKYLKQYTKESGKCVWINTHVTTAAARVEKESMEIPAPKKADIEGGNKFANKADDVIMIHRHIYSKEKRFQTELHVAKVKVNETGGRVTPFIAPVILESVYGLVGFTCNGVNPVEEFHGQYNNNFPKIDFKEDEPW